MTKGQNEAFVIIFKHCQQNQGTIAWGTIVQQIKNAKCKVSNWLTVRDILQWFLNENFIKRTANLHVEEYLVTNAGAGIADLQDCAEWYKLAKRGNL